MSVKALILAQTKGGALKLLPIILLFAGSLLIGQGTYIKAKATFAQVLLERAWQETVDTGQITKAWPWADTFPVAAIEVLGRSKGRIIALDGSSGEALAFAPGHLHNTAKPGQRGTAVYAAHRDTHFAFLKDAAKGDVIEVVDRLGAKHRYQIEHMRIAPWDQSGITLDDSVKRIALVTCWPFDAKTPGPLRYIVEGSLIE